MDWNQSRQILHVVDDPLLFATGGGDSGFHLIYTRLDSDRLPLTAERPIISRLLKDYPYALFMFSNREQTDWHFVNVKHITQKHRLLRRITIGPTEKLRTASERIAMLDAESLDSPLEIQSRHDKAFDVEAVSKRASSTPTNLFSSACRMI